MTGWVNNQVDQSGSEAQNTYKRGLVSCGFVARSFRWKIVVVLCTGHERDRKLNTMYQSDGVNLLSCDRQHRAFWSKNNKQIEFVRVVGSEKVAILRETAGRNVGRAWERAITNNGDG